jgi:hypothetical protein
VKKYFLLIALQFFLFSLIAQNELSKEDKQTLADQKAAAVVEKLITPVMTEFEKVLVLHEYITDNVEYGKLNGETSAWTALCNDKADCVGFARGLHTLFQAADINSTVIVRKKGHLWVKVELYGKYYNIDPTWCALKSRWPQYSWFLLNDEQNVDEEKGVDHVLEHPEKYPIADDLFIFQQDYYQNKDLLRSGNKIRLIGTIQLPDGRTAPEQGIIGSVNGSRFKIPYNENSVFFISSIRRDSEKPFIQYTINNDANSDYSPDGYWGEHLTVIGKHEAKQVDLSGDDITDISLTIQPLEYFFKGEISLPKNEAAAKGGVYITMTLTEAKERKISYHRRVYIPGGESSASFVIGISPNDRKKEFYLYYWAPKLEKQGFKKYAYYHSKNTVPERKDAEILSVKKYKRKNLDVEIIK